MKKALIIATLLILGFVPAFTGAEEPPPGGGGGATPAPKVEGIENPIKKYNTLDELILGVVDGVVTIGFYVVVLAIVWTGFLFVKAQGNKGELENAKKAFLYTVIGTAILLGARLIAEVIEGTVDQLEEPAQAVIQHNEKSV